MLCSAQQFDCKQAGGCLMAGQECAEDETNGGWVCGPARTCRVLVIFIIEHMCLLTNKGSERVCSQALFSVFGVLCI